MPTLIFVIPAALIYKSKKSFKGALLSLVVGFVSAVIVMTLWNIIITPIYMGIDRTLLINKFLLPIVIFNMVKTIVNISLVLLLYKPVITALRAIRLIEKKENSSNSKTTLTMLLIGGVLLVVSIGIWLLLKYFG